MTTRNALIGLAAAGALLLSAAPASAWTASASNGTVTVTGLTGEKHDAIVEGAAGAATASNGKSDSVVVTDKAAPVTGVGSNCTRIADAAVRCATASGVSQVTVDYRAGTAQPYYNSADDVIDVPVTSSPFSYNAMTGAGNDDVTVYGPVGASASLGDGNDYILVSISGTTPVTPPGGTIEGGVGGDYMRLVDRRHETPVCGPADWWTDLLQSDPDENSADCDLSEHPTLPN